MGRGCHKKCVFKLELNILNNKKTLVKQLEEPHHSITLIHWI